MHQVIHVIHKNRQKNKKKIQTYVLFICYKDGKFRKKLEKSIDISNVKL